MTSDITLKPVSRNQSLSEPLRSWASARTDYPRSSTVASLFEEIAAAYPNNTALIIGSRRMSYSELNGRANRLAHELGRMGVRNEVLVGLCLERSAELIVALLAILKAGGAYVPLDPSYPRERLDFMLNDTRTPLVITQKSLASLVVKDRKIASIIVDEGGVSLSAGDAANPVRSSDAENLAYVMYTSGSTGTPKGVLVENRSIVRLVRNTNFCRFGPQEIFLQLAPVSFDASTFEIWGALLNAATLVVMPPQTPSLQEIGCAVSQHGVTTLWLTAGLFHLFVDERISELRPLKQLLAGGEALSASHVRRALENLPATTLINGYGPTEGTTFTCCHVMKHNDVIPDSVPLGRPISNTAVYILDQELRPVSPGQNGELCVGGDGVARGYLNAPELTAEKFIPDSFSGDPGARMYRTGDLARWREDGTVEFLGRLDSQIKILGHRIEPGEIEAALRTYPGIRQVLVVADIDKTNNKRLLAYYVSGDGIAPTASALKDFLSAKLPVYMIPAFYIAVPSLPLTPNGKVDRAALPNPVFPVIEPAVESSTSQLEIEIAGIWKNVLHIEHTGLDENFFDIGGDSLLLVAVHSRLQKLLPLDIPVTDLFEFTTIRTLAQHLGKSATAAPSFTVAQKQAQKQRQAFARQRAVKGGRP